MYNLRPKRDKSGFYRNIGYATEGSRSQPKIRLGRDEVEATERLARIVRLWQWVGESQHDQPQTIWGPFLDLARAIGKGETAYILPKARFRSDNATGKAEDSTYAATLVMLSMQPVIDVVAEDETRQRKGQDALRKMGKARQLDRKAEQALTLAEAWREISGQPPVAGSLHEVLRAFSDHLAEEYHDPTDNTISDHGKTRQRQAKTLLRLLPDSPLSVLDFAGCQNVYNILRRRPPKTDGKPYEQKTCQHLIATLSKALDFADTSTRWRWEMPSKWARIKKTVARIAADDDKPVEIPTYSPAEIATLWRFARPSERLLLALALNCGMGADQIGRLTIDRCKLRDDKPSYIVSRRYKRKVIGRWRLWGVTTQLIKWAIENRPSAAKHNILVVNRKGKPLYGKSANGDRSRQIANAWYRLLDRVAKKQADFRRLGFNSLRDTSADTVRQVAGGELATVQLAHKHATGDALLANYTNPMFKKLAKVLAHIERKLSPVWEAVPDPTSEPPRPNSSAFARMEV